MNKEQGNKLIAESPFASDSHKRWMMHIINTDGNIDKFVREAKYHSSWDWLMPVVEKIGKIKNISIGIYSSGMCCIDRDADGGNIEISTVDNYANLIDNVWNAVVQFLQWYNKNK